LDVQTNTSLQGATETPTGISDLSVVCGQFISYFSISLRQPQRKQYENINERLQKLANHYHEYKAEGRILEYLDVVCITSAYKRTRSPIIKVQDIATGEKFVEGVRDFV